MLSFKVTGVNGNQVTDGWLIFDSSPGRVLALLSLLEAQVQFPKLFLQFHSWFFDPNWIEFLLWRVKSGIYILPVDPTLGVYRFTILNDPANVVSVQLLGTSPSNIMFFTLSDCLFSVADSINLIWRRHICRGFSFVRWHAKFGLFKSFDCSLIWCFGERLQARNCIHLGVDLRV